MNSAEYDAAGPRRRVLWLSTWAFTLLFAVWLMLGVLGPTIKKAEPELLLGPAIATMSASEIAAALDSRFEWLLAAAILSGSLLRLNFGIWADQFGGRAMMLTLLLLSAAPTYLVTRATNFEELLICAALFGLAGNSFAVGIAWNSAWFPARSKGTALGVFGAGNVGASGTKLLVGLAPAVLTVVPAAGYFGGLIPGGWRGIPALYAALLVLTAIAILFVAPSPDRRPGRGRPVRDMLTPLKFVRVWRFSLYYVVVFGAYVALSGWLPSYYVTTYGIPLRSAALLTALYIFPASLLRPLGGYLSDKYGPRVVTYGVFLGMAAALVPLCIPKAALDIGVGGFAACLFLVGVGMGVGKASVYKYIPNYFPNDVGAVGGLVGLLGALGGFLLPKMFGTLGRATGVPQLAFAVLLGLTLMSLAWLHITVLRMRAEEREQAAADARAEEGVGVA